MGCERTVVIDELKICYVTNVQDLAVFESVDIGYCFEHDGYSIIRLANDRFKFFFEIIERDEVVALLKFGLYTDTMVERTYVYFRVSNHILYDRERLKRLLDLPASFGMLFNNFTSLDLAVDSDLNYTSIMKRMLRDRGLTTIINGKAIKDRKSLLTGVTFEYSTSLNRLRYPTITVKQKKAIINKNEGITVQCYDKKAEIDNHSNKQYILDYYDNPKRLYRLEVRLHYQELKDYFSGKGITPSIDVLNDSELLRDMFIYHLSSVIRFSRGRNRIPWETLLRCNDGG